MFGARIHLIIYSNNHDSLYATIIHANSIFHLHKACPGVIGWAPDLNSRNHACSLLCCQDNRPRRCQTIFHSKWVTTISVIAFFAILYLAGAFSWHLCYSHNYHMLMQVHFGIYLWIIGLNFAFWCYPSVIVCLHFTIKVIQALTLPFFCDRERSRPLCASDIPS